MASTRIDLKAKKVELEELANRTLNTVEDAELDEKSLATLTEQITAIMNATNSQLLELSQCISPDSKAQSLLDDDALASAIDEEVIRLTEIERQSIKKAYQHIQQCVKKQTAVLLSEQLNETLVNRATKKYAKDALQKEKHGTQFRPATPPKQEPATPTVKPEEPLASEKSTAGFVYTSGLVNAADFLAVKAEKALEALKQLALDDTLPTEEQTTPEMPVKEPTTPETPAEQAVIQVKIMRKQALIAAFAEAPPLNLDDDAKLQKLIKTREDLEALAEKHEADLIKEKAEQKKERKEQRAQRRAQKLKDEADLKKAEEAKISQISEHKWKTRGAYLMFGQPRPLPQTKALSTVDSTPQQTKTQAPNSK